MSLFSYGNILGDTPDLSSIETNKNSGTWNLNAAYINSLIGYKPTLVTDSLFIHLDAGDAISYPGTGTAWFDISGNNRNFTLGNSGAYNSSGPKYMDFRGSYGQATTTTAAISGNVTYVVATRILVSTSDWRTLTRNDTSSQQHHVIIQTGANDVGSYNGGFFDSGFDQTSFPNYSTSDWIFLYFRWTDGFGYKMSYNDTPEIIRGDLSSNASARFIDGISRIGGYNNTSQYWGDISLFMVYNRYLSDSELLENFLYYRDRHGL